MNADDPIILTLKGIRKNFRNLPALCGVSGSVRQGEVTAFIGANGAGKTTLFHCIAGDLRPDAGTILFRRRPLIGLSPWQIARLSIGRLFQDSRVFQHLTALENVAVALYSPEELTLWGSLRRVFRQGRLAARTRSDALGWLREVGLERKADTLAKDLSWGNQRLLALGRLLAGRFDCLLLDEPTSGVSLTMIEPIKLLVRKLVAERGATVLLIEHNLHFVAEVADTTYVLFNGSVLGSGPTSKMLLSPEAINAGLII